jgi:hypothetical protein
MAKLNEAETLKRRIDQMLLLQGGISFSTIRKKDKIVTLIVRLENIQPIMDLQIMRFASERRFTGKYWVLWERNMKIYL